MAEYPSHTALLRMWLSGNPKKQDLIDMCLQMAGLIDAANEAMDRQTERLEHSDANVETLIRVAKEAQAGVFQLMGMEVPDHLKPDPVH
jgi:hypothetical protein